PDTRPRPPCNDQPAGEDADPRRRPDAGSRADPADRRGARRDPADTAGPGAERRPADGRPDLGRGSLFHSRVLGGSGPARESQFRIRGAPPAPRDPATRGDPLDPELPRDEVQDPPVRILGVSALGEPVALIWIDHVLDAAAERAKALDDLIGFLLRDTRVVLALEDQHRAAHVVDVRDRRTLDELRAVVLEITDPSCQEATPVRLRVLDHGHKVRDAENVDGTPPHVGYLRHAEERREPAIRAAIDGEARAVEVLLFGHPVGHRAQISQIDPAPIFMDRGLPLPSVAGRAVDVRHDERDPAMDQCRKMRQVRTESRTRLAFGSAMRIENRRCRSAGAAGAVHEAWDLAVGAGDADELRLDAL